MFSNLNHKTNIISGHAYGFAGKNHLHNALVDVLAEAIGDAGRAEGISDWPLVLLGMVPVPEEFGKGLDKGAYFHAKVLPSLQKHAELVDRFLVEHEELFGGRSLTWSEVLAAEFFSHFIDLGPDRTVLDGYPHVKRLIAKVTEQPKIKKYIELRPRTPA